MDERIPTAVELMAIRDALREFLDAHDLCVNIVDLEARRSTESIWRHMFDPAFNLIQAIKQLHYCDGDGSRSLCIVGWHRHERTVIFEFIEGFISLVEKEWKIPEMWTGEPMEFGNAEWTSVDSSTVRVIDRRLPRMLLTAEDIKRYEYMHAQLSDLLSTYCPFQADLTRSVIDGSELYQPTSHETIRPLPDGLFDNLKPTDSVTVSCVPNARPLHATIRPRTSPQPSPASNPYGFTLISINSSSATITWQGSSHTLSIEHAKILEALCKIPGSWVSSSDMKRSDSILNNENRFDRKINKLPPDIRGCIESQTARGYRLRDNRLT